MSDPGPGLYVDGHKILGPRKKQAPPKQYDPTTFHAPPTRSGPATSHVQPPPVPGGTGKGNTVVDTPSLDLFADNMDKLAEPVKLAYQKLSQLKPVAPGAFYDAYELRSAAAGANGDQGLQNTYLKMLNDLHQGLSDISTGVRGLSKKYTSVEQDNKMTTTDLSNAFESAQGDFSKLNSGG